MPSWKEKCTFLNPQNAGVVETINGTEVRFYPVSVGKLFELRAIAQPLAESLMVLMTDTSSDSGVNRVQEKDGRIEEYVMPPSPETIDARMRHQSKAIRELTEAFTSPQNLGIIGGVFIDSLRDIFPAGSQDNPPGAEFINSISANDLPKFIKGMARANNGVLGDLGGNASGLLDGVLGKVKARANAAANAEAKSGETPNEKPSESNAKQPPEPKTTG